jgi:hypothetical protein
MSETVHNYFRKYIITNLLARLRSAKVFGSYVSEIECASHKHTEREKPFHLKQPTMNLGLTRLQLRLPIGGWVTILIWHVHQGVCHGVTSLIFGG